MNYFKQNTQLVGFFLAVLLGLVAARRIEYRQTLLLAASFVFMAAVYRWQNVLSCLLLLCCGFQLGLFRGTAYMYQLSRYKSLFARPVVVTAQAETDAVYSDKGMLSFDANQLVVRQPETVALLGKIKVEGRGESMVYRGDQLQVSGKLSPTRGAAQARMSFANIKVTQRHQSRLDVVRRRFIAGLQSSIPEPEASFGAGLLLGQRSTIPKEVNDQLSVTGLTHLVAVSGYNLTIIIMAVRKLLQKGSKFQIVVAASALMLVFVMLTGLSASIIRAALVSSLSLLAWYYGRQFKPVLLLALAAAITAAWNPYYIWSDIGWYLSFLAFFGVLVIAPAISGLRRKSPKLLGSLVTETVSAQVMTVPIIMYIFGRVSIIGLVANVLVVPLVPLAMLLTLIAGLGPLSWLPVSGLLAWPAKTLLTYMIDISAQFSRLPHAAAELSIDVYSMTIAYGAIVIVVMLLKRIAVRRNVQNVLE